MTVHILNYLEILRNAKQFAEFACKYSCALTISRHPPLLHASHSFLETKALAFAINSQNSVHVILRASEHIRLYEENKS